MYDILKKRRHCDPRTAGWINANDQIIPYLSLYLFSDNYPGVAGIYMSAVFGASLSTVQFNIVCHTFWKKLKFWSTIKHLSTKISIWAQIVKVTFYQNFKL